MIDCPACGWEGSIDASLVGRRMKCPKCKESFTAEVGGSYELEEVAPPPPSRVVAAPPADPGPAKKGAKARPKPKATATPPAASAAVPDDLMSSLEKWAEE